MTASAALLPVQGARIVRRGRSELRRNAMTDSEGSRWEDNMRRTFKAAFLIVVLVIALMLAPIGGSSQAQTRPTFSLASLPSAVLEAMGEPGRKSVSSLDDQTWYYGASWVRFVQGLVREYLNTGNLQVNLGSKSAKPFLVWLGCHRVTVIAALGTPTSVTRTTPTGAIWGYKRSSITLGNDKVIGWTDKGELKGHLKAVTVASTSSSSWLASLPTSWWTTAPTTYVYSPAVTSGTPDWDFSSLGTTYYPRVPTTIIGGHSFIAENGSYYGQISDLTGRPKTVWVSPYYKADGTYVRSHWRSLPGGH